MLVYQRVNDLSDLNDLYIYIIYTCINDLNDSKLMQMIHYQQECGHKNLTTLSMRHELRFEPNVLGVGVTPFPDAPCDI